MTPAEVIAMRDKLARVGWNDACADGLCPSFCNHRKAECPTCQVEWAWGADVSKIEQLVAEHNERFHGVVAPPKNEGGNDD